jgi:hypothetical protein
VDARNGFAADAVGVWELAIPITRNDKGGLRTRTMCPIILLPSTEPLQRVFSDGIFRQSSQDLKDSARNVLTTFCCGNCRV